MAQKKTATYTQEYGKPLRAAAGLFERGRKKVASWDVPDSAHWDELLVKGNINNIEIKDNLYIIKDKNGYIEFNIDQKKESKIYLLSFILLRFFIFCCSACSTIFSC